MWGKITRVIKNWAYEEVEVEVEVSDNPREMDNKPKSSSSPAKMAYKYPQNIPLRFPLIQENFTSNKTTKRKNKSNTIKSNHKNQVNSVYNAGTTLSPTLSYQRKRDLSKMENVPAYLRKSKARPKPERIIKQEREEEIKIKEEAKQQQHFEKLKRGSTPDELDAVFKKLEKRPQVNQEKEPEKVKKSPSLSPKINEPMTSKYVPEQDEKIEYSTEHISAENEFNDYNLETHVKQRQLTETPIADSQKDIFQRDLEVEPIQPQKVVKPVTFEEREKVPVPMHLLNDREENNDESSSNWLQEQSDILKETLNHFNVGASVVNVTQGPTVTSFELRPESGVKVSRIRNLSDDLKLNLAAQDIRIQAPIPGKNTVGIEVPNEVRQVVSFQDVIENETFKYNENPLPIALGLTVEGEPLITSINKMPHGLIAGATGSGKSVCINTILLSLIYKCHHEDVKFLLIDPKMIELSPYNGIPHLVSPVITDAKAASASLKWAVNEMEDRYKKFVEYGVRDIAKYNQKVTDKADKMPYLVIVIDELADLMMVSPQEVEDAICRIAQKARAAGIHLLVATQRPSVDVITGLIKANIPTRIAFSVSSQIDSRTILDEGGAEKLLGRGDMLFMESGSNKLLRLQGPFVSDEEIERVTNHARSIAEPTYLFEQAELLESLVEEEEEDELLGEVILFITEHNRASTSLLQRRFRIGYNRAARIIDTLEYKGLISSQNGPKPRDVLISKEEADQLNLQLQD
ncbi:MAG TPA: DNA translocase FtsK [Pseudogracilibacillus sp.]|nr:DNA translocase FtsK [Pseudogracilibacillus sp.]